MGILDSIRDLLSGRKEKPSGGEAQPSAGGLSPRPAEEAWESVEDVVRPAVGEGDLLGVVGAALGGLEKLIGKIPGYKGYKDKEMRREADSLLRTQVALAFEDQRRRLSELQVRLVSQAQLEHIDQLERAAMKFQLLIDRIKTASYGYAGLFDAVKVKEEQLDALYDFDNKMLDYADEVADDIDRVTTAIGAREGLEAAVADLIETIEDANRTFGHREEVILKAAE
jgi:hypothetical protein